MALTYRMAVLGSERSQVAVMITHCMTRRVLERHNTQLLTPGRDPTINKNTDTMQIKFGETMSFIWGSGTWMRRYL